MVALLMITMFWFLIFNDVQSLILDHGLITSVILMKLLFWDHDSLLYMIQVLYLLLLLQWFLCLWKSSVLVMKITWTHWTSGGRPSLFSQSNEWIGWFFHVFWFITKMDVIQNLVKINWEFYFIYDSVQTIQSEMFLLGISENQKNSYSLRIVVLFKMGENMFLQLYFNIWSTVSI